MSTAGLRVAGAALDVAAAAAELIAARLRSGARTLVLAGGHTPLRAYAMLAGMDVEWGRVTVLFGDERCVAPDHPDSNFGAAREALLDRVSPASVHRIPAELGAEAAADHYSDILRGLGPLDLVLLGIGPDGHTASLFPGNPALEAVTPAVAVHGAPKPPPDRVSLSLPTLRAAREVVFVATGADKAGAVRRAREGSVPAGLIPGATWLVDAEAAG